MKEGNGLPGNWGRSLSWRLILLIYSPALLLLAGVAIAAKALGVESGDFMRDPAHIVGTPFYTGLISNLGITVWCAGAVIALFAAFFLPPSRKKRFLIWSGILTLYLMVDDVAMLHDDVFRSIFNTYEQVILLAYVPVAWLYISRFRRELFEDDIALLVLAFAFMGISLTLDQWHLMLRIFGRMILPSNELLEDGAKLLAQVSWMAYLVRRSADAVQARGVEAGRFEGNILEEGLEVELSGQKRNS